MLMGTKQNEGYRKKIKKRRMRKSRKGWMTMGKTIQND
jgi:hypothetical protein